MPKKPADIILRILKNAGVELKDDIAETVKEELEKESSIVLADSVIGQKEYDELEEKNKELRTDLFTLRKKKNEAQEEADRLKKLVDTGESDLKRENQLLKTKLEKLEPLSQGLLEDVRKNFEAVSGNIPEDEKIRAKFKWPEKEGDKLSDDDVLSNWRRYQEFRELGVPGFDGKAKETPTPPGAPRTPPGKPGPEGAENLEGKSSSDLLLSAYGNPKEG